ncbi:MAG: riboflavin synthase [Planctomycetes bacterium]|nr:riboflavin synthase [Planctomycetota bacterium]
MFTGIIVATGTVTDIRKVDVSMELWVSIGDLAALARRGDSIALSGVCCTITDLRGDQAHFHLSRETLDRTWLGRLEPGGTVNLEPALRLGDALGGHLVQGHVDAVGEVVGPVGADGGDWRLRVPAGLRRFCVEKGSITVDGVSLTVAHLHGDEITVAIIPHTARVTTIGRLPAGAPVNLEVDVIGKYVEQMLAARFGDAPLPAAGA